jgi:hypothetical protein
MTALLAKQLYRTVILFLNILSGIIVVNVNVNDLKNLNLRQTWKGLRILVYINKSIQHNIGKYLT